MTIYGTPEDALGDHANDYMESMILVVKALHGETPWPRTPTELFAEPAKWVAAFDFLQPYAIREIEEERERKRKGG